jgi:hypothetical protein
VESTDYTFSAFEVGRVLTVVVLSLLLALY